MLYEDIKNSKIITSSVSPILDLIKELIKNNHNPIIIINLHNTLSESNKLKDDNIKNLIKTIIEYNKDNLLFITDENPNFGNVNHIFLNKLNILDYLNYYNIIHTDGKLYSTYLLNNILNMFSNSDKKNHIIYIDHDENRIDEVTNIIDDERISYYFFILKKFPNNFLNIFGLLNTFEIKQKYKLNTEDNNF